MAKKKSYNPFKMWGAWLGAITGGLFTFIGGWWNVCKACDSQLNRFYGISGESFSWLFGLIIIGFIVGWGIHSIVRKVRG